MAITLINNAFVENTTSGATLSVPYQSTCGTGNLLIACVGGNGSFTPGTTVTSIVDDAGNTYVQASGALGQAVDGSWTAHSDIWYCANSVAGGTTATITWSGSLSARFGTLSEYTGAKTSGVLDTTNHNSGGGPVDSAAITPSVTGELLVCVAVQGQYVFTNADSPFNFRSHSPDSGYATADQINPALSSQTVIYRPNNSTTPFDFCTSIASFFPAPSGPSGKKKGSMFLVF